MKKDVILRDGMEKEDISHVFEVSGLEFKLRVNITKRSLLNDKVFIK